MLPKPLVIVLAAASLSAALRPAEATEPGRTGPVDRAAACRSEPAGELAASLAGTAEDAVGRSPGPATGALAANPRERPPATGTEGLPECEHGQRELIGCCSNNSHSKWRCWNYCCTGNQCGLLCPRVWCEFYCPV